MFSTSKINYLFIVVVLSILIGHSTSSTLIRYAPLAGEHLFDKSYSETGCSNIGLNVVIDEPKVILSIKTNNPHVTSFSYSIDKIIGTQYLIKVVGAMTYDTQNTVLSIVVKNSENIEFVHTLTNYPLVCNKFPMSIFETATYSSFEYSYLVPLITFYMTTTMNEFQSTLTCTSNAGTCSVSQGYYQYEQFACSITVSNTVFNLDNIQVTFTNLFGESYTKSFINPYKAQEDLGITLANRTEYLSSYFDFNGNANAMKVSTFDLTGPKNIIGYTFGNDNSMDIALPVSGNKNSRKAMITASSALGSGLTTIYGPNSVLDTFDLGVLAFTNKPAWTFSNEFVLDITAGIPLQKIIVNDVAVSKPFTIQSYSSYKHLPYPYGFKKVASKEDGYSYTSVTFQPPLSMSNFQINANSNHSSTYVSSSAPSFGTPDTLSPILEIVSKRYIDENTIVYRLHIIDAGSGVFKIMTYNPFGEEFYAIDCLVQGTMNDGHFDIPLNLSKTDISGVIPQFAVFDLYNRVITTTNRISTNLQLDDSLLLTKKSYFSLHDITYFEFNHHTFDESSQIMKSSLFLNVTNIQKGLKPVFVYADPSHQVDGGYKSFTGYFDEGIQMYRIDFDVPKMPAYTNLVYFIRIPPTTFNFLNIVSKFGPSTLITFDKKDYDNYPPMISKSEFINENYKLIQPNEENVVIGWRFTIVDRPAGLKSGNISIISNFDGEPRNFNFDSTTRVSGNQFEGVYEIKFTVPANSRNQTFIISQVNLFDENDKSSIHPVSSSVMFSPFLQLNDPKLDIVVEYRDVEFESTLPTLTTFTYEKFDHNVFKFKFSTSDSQSGISARHNPYVFVKGHNTLYQKVSSVVISKVQNVVNYEATAMLDYPITFHGCLFSVYGITDNHLNINGYSPLDLKASSFSYYYKQSPSDLFVQYIESTSPITQMGGRLTIFGKRFLDQSIVLVNNAIHNTVSISSSMIVIDMAPMKAAFSLVVQTDVRVSNQMIVTPTLFSNPSFIYVEPTSTCTADCGAFDKPFSTIKSAIDSSKLYNTIVLKDGTYSGKDNTNFDLSSKTFVEITSLNGFSKSIIDCKKYTYFMKLFSIKKFSISDITIQNCVGNKGGALYIQDSVGSFRDVHFINNRATNGAGVYSHHSDLKLTNTLFNGNKVWHDGAAIFSYLSKVNIEGELTRLNENKNLDEKDPLDKDIFCKNSTISISDQVAISPHTFQCTTGCVSSYPHRALCQDYDGIVPSSKCGDSICDETESCLSCPSECSCNLGGLVLETFEQGCDIKSFDIGSTSKPCISKKNSTISTPINLENFMGGMNNIIVRLFGYIKVDSTKQVPFTFQGNHFGLLFKVNGQQQFFFNQITKFNETTTIYLSNQLSHYIEIILYSNNPDGKQRLFNLVPFADPNIRLFYSNLVCGDGLLNEKEKNQYIEDTLVENKLYCPSDSKYPTYNNNIVCGDGICNESPNSCYQDCYKEMTKTCPTRKVPDGHISPGFYFSGDTLGDMISNQFIWRLPGSEHLSFGINIVTGEEAPSPIFQFDYCSNVASNVIEDPYRGNVYHIPPEFHGKAFPQCTYSTSTTSYSSVEEMSKEMQQSSSEDYSASVGGSYSFISGSASVAYSKEKSTSEARKMSTSFSQTIFKTDLLCKSSFVEMDLNKVSLHPNLLNELADVKDEQDMLVLVRKHGTHFYKKTYFGGKLSQLTITQTHEVTTENKDEWSESSSGSFSASISSPTFSVSGSVSASVDRSQSEEQQQQKSETSTTSRLLIYGGMPAAFSPAEDGRSSPGFKDWAQSIDVLPVPVDFQLYPIRDLIKSEWINKNNINLLETWKNAELMFYVENGYNSNIGDTYSLIFQFKPYSGKTLFSLPRLNIKYFTQDESDPTKNVEHTFNTLITYTQTDPTGNKVTSTFNNDDSDKEVSTDYSAFEENNVNIRYAITAYGYNSNMKYLLKFDFSGPDFFSSTMKPEISITSDHEIEYNQPAKILHWESSTAILFNENGVIDDSLKLYFTCALEVLWSGRFFGNLNDFTRESAPMNHLKCKPNVDCFDEMKFTYLSSIGDAGSFIKPYIYQYDKQLTHETHEWFSFSVPIVPNEKIPSSIYAIVTSRIGMMVRTNWLKSYYPNAEIPWKHDIHPYHIKSEDPKSNLEYPYNWVGGQTGTFANMKQLRLKQYTYQSQPKQLFYYKNYNYKRDPSVPYSKTYRTSYYSTEITNTTTIPTFIEDGVQ